MPSAMSVQDFLDTSWEDIKSPTTSRFVSKMPKYRLCVDAMEETLDFERSGLNKTRKSVKALYNTGSLFVSNQEYFAENLTKIGDSTMKESASDDEMQIGVAFMKFHSLTKQLAAIMKSLMQHMNNIIMFPLESFMKGDLRESGVDVKKTFDKAWKDYYTKYTKLDKEKKQIAREHGMYRADLSGAEVAEDLEKERRMVQLQMCEYLIKVNEIKMKKGAEFLQHLIEYYGALDTYFEEGKRTVENFNTCIDSLSERIHTTRSRCDAERRDLVELRDNLRTQISSYKDNRNSAYFRSYIVPVHKETTKYNLHQVQGNKAHGYEKTGYLLKKSEGMVRKTWLRRKVTVKDGYMYISRSDANKDPVKLNLLTCQTKPSQEDNTGRSFDLVSGSQIRTYHFQAEDAKEFEEWVSVLNNAKEAVLMKAFGDNSSDKEVNSSVKELTRSILAEVKKLPGNQTCCDCGAPDPEWLSCNLGVLVCLECCGTHRQMGVHISRMQSIVIDDLGTSQLLLARVVGNRNFNDIIEARLDPAKKPKPSQDITAESKAFIVDKYEHHKYCIKMYTNTDDVINEVRQAILSKDISALLQVFAEGHNIQSILLDEDETPLHLAIRTHDGASLHIVDFIIQNSRGPDLDAQTATGDTVLHYCVQYSRSECMKLVLKTRPQLAKERNAEGKTAMELATEMGLETCVELLNHAQDKKSHVFNHVNIDWDLIQDDHIYDPVDAGDFSDDDLDESRPRKPRSRPQSSICQFDIQAARERSDSPDYHRQNSNLLSFKPESQSHPSILRAHSEITPTKVPPPRPKTPNSSTFTGTLPPSLKKKPAPPPPESETTSRRDSNCRGMDNPIYFRHEELKPPPAGITPSTTTSTATSTAGSTAGSTATSTAGSTATSTAGSTATSTAGGGSSSGSTVGKAIKPPPMPKPLPRSVNALSSPEGFVNGHRRSKSHDSLSTRGNGSSGEPGRTPPVPTPRQRKQWTAGSRRRCRALYPCTADKTDELSFSEGEVILVLKEEDDDWWEGEIESDPGRRGMFPVSFVHILTDV